MTDREYFCAAAWTGLYLDPDGTVDFCCLGKNNLGNIKENSIQEILQGDRVRQIRASMLDDEPVAGCDACWRQNPEHRLQKFFNLKYLAHIQIGPVQHTDTSLDDRFYSDLASSRIKYLDLRWNNTCNFACMYCGPKYSSLWAEHRGQNTQAIELTAKPARSHKRTVFDFLDHALETVDWIYLAGGEPLAIKENVEILDRLWATNPDCVLQVNTNLSLLDDNPVFDRLTRFNHVRWMVSGEALSPIFEYLRWPGQWSIFLKNLKKIQQLRNQGHTITFNLVAMNINHLSVWDYIDYLLDDGLALCPADINLNIYNSRDDRGPYAIQRMPELWKDQIMHRLTRRHHEIQGIGNYLASLGDPVPDFKPRWSGLESTIAALRAIDVQRGTDSQQIFRHVYDYIERDHHAAG